MIVVTRVSANLKRTLLNGINPTIFAVVSGAMRASRSGYVPSSTMFHKL